MRHIQLSYALQDQPARTTAIHNDLMALLLAVRTQGSIARAAHALSLSYRHVWGALKQWEASLGQPLVVWERGQAAQLTAFADKLLWTEQLAQARLAPHIQTLRAELERTLALAFDPQAHVLSLHASHDDALPQLQAHAAQQARLHLDIRYGGSVDALRALNDGRCSLAGFHCRTAATPDSLTARTYQPLLQPGRHKLIGFARRHQGLMVAAGNPLRITGLGCIAQRGLHFVNRAPGAGTRVLLDELLQTAQVRSTDLKGYRECEPSHSAVALAVASGQADAGLGTESAARAQGLSFVPLAVEHYYLVCLKAVVDQPSVQALRAVLAESGWQDIVGALPGYEPESSGMVLPLRRALPWWPAPGRQAAPPRRRAISLTS